MGNSQYNQGHGIQYNIINDRNGQQHKTRQTHLGTTDHITLDMDRDRNKS